MDYKEFFGCKYPIVAASMNQVSNIELAIACYNAGIFPSLPIYSYSLNNLNIDYLKLDSDIKYYQDKTGSSNIMLTAGVADVLYDDLFSIIIKNKIKHIELLANDYSYNRETKNTYVEHYKSEGVKLIPKVLMFSQIITGNISAVIVKGKDGAGRGIVDIDPIIEITKKTYPELPIIASGGISSREDIKKYLSMGSIAVCIGTLLAASNESPLSTATKQKMIESTYENVTRFKTGSEQNALIFSHIENDDLNHTQSLIHGIKDPTKGHVFAGKGIDHIKSILPVKDIVQLLVDGL